MTKHSLVVGGSSASRVLNCGPSNALLATLPKLPPGEFASEGTMLHSVIEQIISGDATADELIKTRFEEKGHAFSKELNVEMIQPAIKAFDWLEKNIIGTIVFETEQKCAFPGIPRAFGTVDIVGSADDDKTGVVVDWKFGRGVQVDLIRDDGYINEQLLFYACAARSSIPWLSGCEKFVLAIIQPFFDPGLQHVEVTAEQLDAFELDLQDAVNDPETEATTGPWCKFQACQVVCPAKIQRAEKLAQMMPEDGTGPNGSAISRDEIDFAVELADEVADWCATIKSYAHGLATAGHAITGWKLVAKRGRAKWVDEKKLVGRLKRGKIKQGEYYKKTLLTPKQMRLMLADRGIEVKLDDVIAAPSAGTNLVRESATGEPIETNKNMEALSNVL